MLGNATGNYFGSGNRSYLGWYGYALNKIIWAIAATVQAVEVTTRSRVMVRPFGEVASVSEFLDKAFGIVHAVSDTVGMLEDKLSSMARVVMVGEGVLISELVSRVFIILETLTHGGVRLSALVRATLRMNRR